MGAVGGIATALEKPQKSVPGKPTFHSKLKPDNKQNTKEPVKEAVTSKNLEGRKVKDKDTKLHVPNIPGPTNSPKTNIPDSGTSYITKGMSLE